MVYCMYFWGVFSHQAPKKGPGLFPSLEEEEEGRVLGKTSRCAWLPGVLPRNRNRLLEGGEQSWFVALGWSRPFGQSSPGWLCWHCTARQPKQALAEVGTCSAGPSRQVRLGAGCLQRSGSLVEKSGRFFSIDMQHSKCMFMHS